MLYVRENNKGRKGIFPVRSKVVSGDMHNYVPESEWFKDENMQVSWHIHDSEREMFSHLEVKDNNWDGHSTEEKYRRLSIINKNKE